MARRRAIPAALPPDQKQARFRALFLRFYDKDRVFGAALEKLIPAAAAADLTRRAPYWSSSADLWAIAARASYEVPPGQIPPLTAEIIDFVHAVDGLMAKYGLDRLGGSGRDQIIAWCDRYLRARQAGSPHPSTYGPARLSTAAAGLGIEPDVTGTIRPPWLLQSWDPSRERRADANARLIPRARNHIKSELDRIETNADAVGLILTTNPRNAQRDLGWLYQKVRFRRSFQTIYNSLKSPPEGGVDTIRKAVIRMAVRVGVDHHGWETGWR